MLDLEDVAVCNVFQGPTERALAVRLSSDRQRLFVAGLHGVITVWDVPARTLLARLEGTGAEVTGFALSRDGRYLAVADKDGHVRVWNRTMRWVSGGAEPATAVVADSTNQRIYIARIDGVIDVWDVAKGHTLARLRGHTATVTALALDEKRRTLFSASLDGTIGRWSTETHEARGTTRVGQEWVTALAVVPGLEVGYVGTLTGGWQAWSWRDGRRMRNHELRPPGLPIARLLVDESRIWGMSSDGTLLAWHRATGETARPGNGPDWSVPPAEGAVLGSREPWAMRDPLRRLIETENRFGLRLDGFEVKPVPVERYRPHRPRVQAWSKE